MCSDPDWVFGCLHIFDKGSFFIPALGFIAAVAVVAAVQGILMDRRQ